MIFNYIIYIEFRLYIYFIYILYISIAECTSFVLDIIICISVLKICLALSIYCYHFI